MEFLLSSSPECDKLSFNIRTLYSSKPVASVLRCIKVSGLKISFFLNRVISVISVVLGKTTLTISDSTGKTVSMESKIVRVVSL